MTVHTFEPFARAWRSTLVAVFLIASSLLAGAQPSPADSAALRTIVDGGRHPSMRWPQLSDVGADLRVAYEAAGWTPLWSRGGRPTAAAMAMLDQFAAADARGLRPEDYDASTLRRLASEGGLDTPRVHAILASSYLAFGDLAAAALEIKRHLDLVTTELVATSPLAAGSSGSFALVPGRTMEIPMAVAAGETISIQTSSKDFWDTILVVLAPNGTPVVGSDDFKGYMAGLDWAAPAAGTYRLRVTSFEAVSTGTLVVARK